MRLCSSLSLVLFVSSGFAQGVVDSPLAGLPHALSLDPATYAPNATLLDSTRVYVKEVGFSDLPPATPFAVSGKPDFSPAAMFPGVAPRPDIDGMSIGLDWILANAVGEVIPPGPFNWAAMTFSVSRSSVGRPGTVIRREAGGVDGAGADVFSYLFPGGLMPPEIADKVALVQDSRELNVFDGIHSGEIDAHDVFIKLYDLDPAFLAFLPATPTFYFTVTKASIGLVPVAWWSGTIPSGATILMMTWTGASWTAPKPFLTYLALGLLATHDIDALALDLLHGFMLFSTKGTALDEIMFANLNADAITTSIYRFPGVPGETVSHRIGLLAGDDIDAICTFDPGIQNQFMQGAFCGLAQRSLGIPNVPGNITGSIFRRQLSFSGIPMLESWMAKWPAPGPGVAALFVQGTNPPTPLIALHQVARPTTSSFGGDPVRFQIQLPASPVLINVTLDFIWAAASTQVPLFDVALPLRLRL